MLIPGENPGQFSLCGTNVFLIGHKDSNERIMIDAGDISAKNGAFLQNLETYFDHFKSEKMGKDEIFISSILITHAHSDHMGGL